MNPKWRMKKNRGKFKELQYVAGIWLKCVYIIIGSRSLLYPKFTFLDDAEGGKEGLSHSKYGEGNERLKIFD